MSKPPRDDTDTDTDTRRPPRADASPSPLKLKAPPGASRHAASKSADQDHEEGPPSSDARALVNLAIALVDSGLDVLHDHLTDDAQLQHQSALIPGGTLGKHFRHVAETYNAFLVALKADPYEGPPQIDYNALLPESRASVALSVDACRDTMLKVREGLVALSEAGDLDIVFQLPVDVIALTPTRQEMHSTLGREASFFVRIYANLQLWFCSLHAIHHYTMVRVIAVYELGLNLPIEFGTAPATIYYRGKGWKPPNVSIPPGILKAKL